MSTLSDEPIGGPWGDAADVILCVLPLVFLMVVTLSQKLRVPTVTSLPVAAVMMWFVRLAYLGSPANEVHAAVVIGVLDALTPLSIIAGAILLFSTMQHTMCLPWIIQKIKSLSGGHPVAEIFLIGWAFAYLIEGASGFGTPVALAAPMLVELGHPAFNAVVCVLIMNTLATPYGAVGTPIWFGFDGLDLKTKDLLEVSFRVSVIDGVAALVIPIIAAGFLVPYKYLWRSKVFVFLSILSCVIPAVALSYVSYEFSSILGGLIGTGITAALARKGIGLEEAPAGLSPLVKDHPLKDQVMQTHGEDDDHETTPSLPPVFPSTTPQPSPRRNSIPISIGGQRSSTPTSVGVGPRRNSIQVATLYMDPRVDRTDSFESAPGDFFALPSVKPKQLRNPMLFPITYSPMNFRKRLVSRGMQTGIDEEAPPESVQYDELTLADSNAGGSIGSHALPQEEMLSLQAGLEIMDDWGNERSPLVNGICRTFPLWGTVLMLILTRVPQIGIKGQLQSDSHSFGIQFGSMGELRLSSALVVELNDVLDEDSASWRFQLLYVPFILPFVAVSCITLAMFRSDIQAGLSWRAPFLETILRVKSIVVALVGALVLVSLIRKGGNGSPAFIIGSVLADALKDGFIVFSPLVGALGSFFSGSTTVSNLTFGTVQKVAAIKMDRPITSLLALQSMGGTLGNMICINNIISARTVLGLEESEGEFIKKTAPVAAVFYVIGTLVGLIFVF
ncbi:hypothetical protein BSKO_07928 [Bryopsis sp. KO-2023]|nr:hypothetical protein BSKO_07928 [Bryopsis sp. KO-2023]